MKSITLNPKRFGNFTSSEIFKLMSNGRAKDTFGKPYYTYISEKNIERRLGRSIQDDVTARPLSWGTLLEDVVFKIIPTDYKLCSSETVDHPIIKFWKGTPDAEKFDKGKTAVDIKCPMTLKSFCALIDLFRLGGMDAVRNGHGNIPKHPDGEKFYWQIVSHACLLDAEHGELIVYCPYQEELEPIREYARRYEGPAQHRFFWIDLAQDEEMPHLIKGGHYENLNVLRFEIPKEDKALLTNRVLQAGKELVDFHKKG